MYKSGLALTTADLLLIKESKLFKVHSKHLHITIPHTLLQSVYILRHNTFGCYRCIISEDVHSIK